MGSPFDTINYCQDFIKLAMTEPKISIVFGIFRLNITHEVILFLIRFSLHIGYMYSLVP